MPQDLTDDKSTLVHVMAWCRQATSHYLNQCWPRSSTPCCVNRPQWVKISAGPNAGHFVHFYSSRPENVFQYKDWVKVTYIYDTMKDYTWELPCMLLVCVSVHQSALHKVVGSEDFRDGQQKRPAFNMILKRKPELINLPYSAGHTLLTKYVSSSDHTMTTLMVSWKQTVNFVVTNLFLTLNMLNYFKHFKRYIYFLNRILDLAWPK